HGRSDDRYRAYPAVPAGALRRLVPGAPAAAGAPLTARGRCGAPLAVSVLQRVQPVAPMLHLLADAEPGLRRAHCPDLAVVRSDFIGALLQANGLLLHLAQQPTSSRAGQ